jgi:hypothetical protein
MRADDHRRVGPEQRRRILAVAGFGEAGEADAVAQPRAQPRAGDLVSRCGFQGGARFAHDRRHRLLPSGDFGLHQGAVVGVERDLQLPDGRRSSDQIKRPRSRTGSPWTVNLSAPITIRSPVQVQVEDQPRQ